MKSQKGEKGKRKMMKRLINTKEEKIQKNLKGFLDDWIKKIENCKIRGEHTNPIYHNFVISNRMPSRRQGFCGDCFAHIERPYNNEEREEIKRFYDSLYESVTI